METRSINQEITFKAPPTKVYEMLMNSENHSLFTGAQAEISNEVGGTFMAYDGYITGKNLELNPPEKIVQLWRADEEGWDEGHYSTVTFQLKPNGVNNNETLLLFTHKDIPAHKAEDIRKGWIDYYWEPLQEILDS